MAPAGIKSQSRLGVSPRCHHRYVKEEPQHTVALSCTCIRGNLIFRGLLGIGGQGWHRLALGAASTSSIGSSRKF